jgi:hypothetical protein
MSAIVQLWNRHFLWCELVLSIALAVVLVTWSERFGGHTTVDAILDGNRGNLYGTLASVLGALLGFAITAISIILAVADRPRVRALQGSPHNKTLWKTFIASVRCLGFGTVVALSALFIDRDKDPNHIMFYVMAWMLVLAVFRTWRCIWILDNLVRIASA